jgi:hypothetical protein
MDTSATQSQAEVLVPTSLTSSNVTKVQATWLNLAKWPAIHSSILP